MVKKSEDVNVETGEVRFPRFRSAYDHQRGRTYNSSLGGVSLAKQEFKDSCDINLIVKRFQRTGRLDAFRDANLQFLDLTEMPGNYMESLNQVVAAKSAFEALPATARKLFDNDVSVFLEAAYRNPEAVFGKRDAEGRVIAPPPSDAPQAKPEAPAAPTPSE